MDFPFLRFENLEFEVPGKKSLCVTGKISSDQCVVIHGPSGCGKSTLLRVLAGLRTPKSGRFFLGEADLTDVAVHSRRCGFVFQSGALFDHLSVFENIAFGLRNFSPEFSEQLVAQKVEEFLEKVGLKGFDARDTVGLSGGERQRVALARTLICDPQYLLLDEPLSAVDLENRSSLIELLSGLLKDRPIPTILVTHDKLEPSLFSQRTFEWKVSDTCLEF